MAETRAEDTMRKLLTVMIMLLMMTCAAFAEEEGTESGEQALFEQAPIEQVTFDIDKVGMTVEPATYYKTGSAIVPEKVDLTYDGAPLDPEQYPYTLEYSDNVNVGTATVTAYFINEDKSKSITFEIVPAKPGAASITKIQSSKPDVIVSWKSVSWSEYELQISTSSSFSNPATYRQTATTRKIGKLQDGKTYYFRTRACNKENGKTTYGDWSSRSSKVSTTGPVGNKYSLNGEMIKDKTVKYDGSYYYYNKSGIKSGCDKKMWKKVRKAKSSTKYLIAVDCTKNRVCIYKGKKNKWKLKKYWKCTTGKSSTPTIKGTFRVCGKVSHFGEEKGYTCWYATRIKYEYYFHSVIYNPRSKTSIRDGRLGKNLSHGCIRLALGNAQWLYKKCKSGTKIIIY